MKRKNPTVSILPSSYYRINLSVIFLKFSAEISRFFAEEGRNSDKF
ncbi:hypothetical protein LEP1GSC193_1230 [Leptospira alstonii serovar Pingchang str. 80-412]|uniref:Uncharacterized protein n=1 Tax=Leptospira alstonii serovar Pingchang str. 80-412 TaxID=1218564 RepID=T0HAM6_9LEPT|nr:hypothetical protein LEP1GSC193_1230 [Leptospira alstonii serovar Pingchang str. 80-412]